MSGLPRIILVCSVSSRIDRVDDSMDAPLALSRRPYNQALHWTLPRASLEPPVAVGTPVARRPPHRSRRAVFPHRAPRLPSLRTRSHLIRPRTSYRQLCNVPIRVGADIEDAKEIHKTVARLVCYSPQ